MYTLMCPVWLQHSLTCLGSVLTLRPIADLLDAPPEEVSVTAPREPQEPSSTSQSSGSSSEYDEADAWECFQHFNPEDEDWDEDEDEEDEEELEEEELEEEGEYDPRARLSGRGRTLEELGRARLDDEEELILERGGGQRGALVLPTGKAGEQLHRGGGSSSPSLCLSEGDESSAGSESRIIPRGRLIRSTFYSSSQQLSPLSARHMLLRDKLHTTARKQERGRKPLRSSLSGRLNEPLIEYVEDAPEGAGGGGGGGEGGARGQRRGSVHSAMLKSCSFDSGVSLTHPLPHQRRSRSLDESTRRSPASTELREPGEEEEEDTVFSRKNEFTDEEEKGVAEAHLSVASQAAVPSDRGRRKSVVAKVKPRTQGTDEGEPTEEDSAPESRPQVPVRRRRVSRDVSGPPADGENLSGSQASLTESYILEPSSEVSSRAGSLDDFAASCLTAPRRPASSSGMASPSFFLHGSDEEEEDGEARKPPTPPSRRFGSRLSLQVERGDLSLKRSPSRLSDQAPTTIPGNREILQRHASAPALEVKPPSGKSPKIGLMKLFRRQSWTGQSTFQPEGVERKQREGDQGLPKSPMLTLKKKMRASASSLTKLFTRQSSKEDKKGGELLTSKCQL